MELVRNKVAESGIVVLNPADWYLPFVPTGFDLKELLLHGMVLREKDFREQLKATDWSIYTGKLVAVYCSSDAIIPTWAYMLVIQYLKGVAAQAMAMTPKQMQEFLALQAIATADFSKEAGGRIILKGCGDEAVPESIYAALSSRLLEHVSSLMYGEPCSTVPVYKRK